jgi:Sortase (surface protein transpeptidase)
MIIAAVMLFFWQDIREYFTDQVNDRLITAYQDGDDDVKLNPLETFVTGAEQEAAGINIGDDMAGVLEIESADILEPVYKGPLTEEKLRNGVSFLEESDHLDMQNIPIAGHRVEGAGIRFNYIDRASVGDTINFITRDETRSIKSPRCSKSHRRKSASSTRLKVRYRNSPSSHAKSITRKRCCLRSG